ncbi:MAG: lysophospholipid acyltransferase family protein [Rhodospirillaceae bacterium]|nr:lysophospholipid acyltransferase family protein [Rhodospirillaceae bacterium]
MRLDKRILDSDFTRSLICLLAAVYIRFVRLTTRWTVLGDDGPKHYWRHNLPFISSFWHGRLMMVHWCWDRSKPIHLLISMHRDGRLIADTISMFGFHTLAGSTSKGGTSALRAMIGKLKDGEYIGISPDGPRGPRMRLSEGIVSLARMAGVPVIPVTYSIRRRIVINSWDRFVFALPFSRGVIIWGQPIEVPHTADKNELERVRQKIESSLNAITAEADIMCGHEPVKPAPAEEPAS